MKKIVVLTLMGVFAFFFQSLQAQLIKTIEGNGKYVNVTKQVDDFYRVIFTHGFNINYHQDVEKAGLIEVYAEENVLKELSIESKKGRLNIKFPTFKKKDYGIVVLNIYSSGLSEVENNGEGVFETTGLVKGTELSLLVMGSGQIKAENLDYGIVKAKLLTGEGDILLKGQCRYAEFSVTGSGEIRAHDLIAQDVRCTITGNGNVGCYAEKTLKTMTTGSGEVYYLGNPEISRKSIGSGKVKPLKKEIEE